MDCLALQGCAYVRGAGLKRRKRIMRGPSTPFFAFSILILLFALRTTAIIVSPLDLGVDEAQYWLWGQTPRLGYYSKPPLIAWILGVSNWLLGSSVAAVRSASALLHLLTSLMLWRAASTLFDEPTGRIAALLWASLPAVGLGSFIMSTDSIMLLFWSAGFACLCTAFMQPHKLYTSIAIAGAFIGIATLGKYAGLYFLVGFAGWLSFSCSWPKRTRFTALMIFVGFVALFASPTIIFNLSNEFVTVTHVGDNADLDKIQPSITGLVTFLGAQFFVFGPVTFFLLIVGCVLAHKDNQDKTALLRWFILPVLGVICLQAVLREANANWAVAAFPAATLLVARMLVQMLRRNKWLPLTALGTNFILSGLITFCLGLGSLGVLTPNSDPLRRLRAWDSLAADVTSLLAQTGARTLITHRRAEAALMHWHFRNQSPDISLASNVEASSDASQFGNHYHRSYPVSSATPRPFLVMTSPDETPPPFLKNAQGPVATSVHKTSANKDRRIDFWIVY